MTSLSRKWGHSLLLQGCTKECCWGSRACCPYSASKQRGKRIGWRWAVCIIMCVRCRAGVCKGCAPRCMGGNTRQAKHLCVIRVGQQNGIALHGM